MHELFPELDKRLSVPARSLSGGEQQMLVLAQALVSKPAFVLIDELSLGLAPVIVQRLIPTIRAVADGGAGVLLIEQFATVALGLAERAYVMDRGRIRFSGPAERAQGDAGAAADGLPARIRSAAFSAIMIVGAFVFPRVIDGITEASTTRRPSQP